MRKEIEKFCTEIKETYCLFLFDKGKEVAFPYCCKLSADLVTSYLKMVCSDKFQYISTTNSRAYNHAWTYYCDEKERFIIDFTQFQFTQVDISKRIKARDISIEEFKSFIDKERVVLDQEENYMYGLDFMNPKIQKCYGMLNEFQGKLNKSDFLRFLELRYKSVFERTSY